MTDLPSYKLVQRLMHETGFPVADPNDEMVFPGAKFMKLASRLIQYGADQELEACCEWLKLEGHEHEHAELRAARRPKPPSLKEQAHDAYWVLRYGHGGDINETQKWNTIRRALEALPND
jgi:hypothetical protein